MFQEIFIALFKAGLPVGIASYALVWWALRNNYLDGVDDISSMESEVKRLSKDKESKPKGDLVHNKWLAFGGGFYGVVGVLTYAVVELGEIRDFLVQFSGIGDLLSSLSIGLFIGLIVDAFANFIVAIAWPIYWLSDIRSDYIWIWFPVAYLGYWTGARLALQHAGKDSTEGS